MHVCYGFFDLEDQADIEGNVGYWRLEVVYWHSGLLDAVGKWKLHFSKPIANHTTRATGWFNYTKKSLNVIRVHFKNGFIMLMGRPRFCSATTVFAEA